MSGYHVGCKINLISVADPEGGGFQGALKSPFRLTKLTAVLGILQYNYSQPSGINRQQLTGDAH